MNKRELHRRTARARQKAAREQIKSGQRAFEEFQKIKAFQLRLAGHKPDEVNKLKKYTYTQLFYKDKLPVLLDSPTPPHCYFESPVYFRPKI
jgi:hypothetical protein